MHCHEQHRLIAVIEGQGVLHAESGDHRVRAGDALALAPGLRHRLSFAGETPMQLLTVEFVPGSVLTPDEVALVQLVFAGAPVIRCRAAAAAEAQSLLHRIRAEQRREKAAGAVAVRAYLVSLLVLLYRRRPRESGRQALEPEPLLTFVREYMERHYAQGLRLQDLADQAHLSVRQFTARFKRAFGETPMRYLTRVRIGAAQELLRRSGLGVADVAHAVGYENLSHFYRTFVHHTGVSPGRYRLAPLSPRR